MIFNLDINKQVYIDLDNAIDYHTQSKGEKILIAFDESMEFLTQNPFFSVRYNGVRCLPLGKKLPYMIHFTLIEDRKTVLVHALINTSKNPDANWIK